MPRLNINLCTYDRFIPYIKCLKSVKPILGDGVNLHIGIDTKLPEWKINLKIKLTNYILGDKLKYYYTICPARDCIGESRDFLISTYESELFMNLDDDDLLDPIGLKKVLELAKDNPAEIYNFNLYPTESKYKDWNECIKYKAKEFIPSKWYNFTRPIPSVTSKNLKSGPSIGQNTLFSRDQYLNLPIKYRYSKKWIDDFIPNTVMYLDALSISSFPNIKVIVRNRGKHSLGLDFSYGKVIDLIDSLNIVHDYIYTRFSDDKELAYSIWYTMYCNLRMYHAKKSGNELGKLLDLYFSKLI